MSQFSTCVKTKTPNTTASFVEHMLLLRTSALPAGPEWLYELKLDGYRALAFKADGKVQLRSAKDFSLRYPEVVKAPRAPECDRMTALSVPCFSIRDFQSRVAFSGQASP